ncbi:MAG: hypothetical protein D6791_01745 [Chloroflexi bacterium]|nr:MAG: hypothetical protein D6791_01745 [Chloroflexota bacterium]
MVELVGHGEGLPAGEADELGEPAGVGGEIGHGQTVDQPAELVVLPAELSLLDAVGLDGLAEQSGVQAGERDGSTRHEEAGVGEGDGDGLAQGDLGEIILGAGGDEEIGRGMGGLEPGFSQVQDLGVELEAAQALGGVQQVLATVGIPVELQEGLVIGQEHSLARGEVESDLVEAGEESGDARVEVGDDQAGGGEEGIHILVGEAGSGEEMTLGIDGGRQVERVDGLSRDRGGLSRGGGQGLWREADVEGARHEAQDLGQEVEGLTVGLRQERLEGLNVHLGLGQLAVVEPQAGGITFEGHGDLSDVGLAEEAHHSGINELSWQLELEAQDAGHAVEALRVEVNGLTEELDDFPGAVRVDLEADGETAGGCGQQAGAAGGPHKQEEKSDADSQYPFAFHDSLLSL